MNVSTAAGSGDLAQVRGKSWDALRAIVSLIRVFGMDRVEYLDLGGVHVCVSYFGSRPPQRLTTTATTTTTTQIEMGLRRVRGVA